MENTKSALTLATIVGLTTFLFAEVAQFDFINLDDPYLVQNNVSLLRPLSVSLLTDPVAGLYHPLTNFSYWIDAQLGGLRPMAFHITNLIFHLIGVSGLFLFALRLSRSLWCAGLLAAAFAWHPTHVESVAWISERKDVISAAFFWWALFAHLGGRYCLAIVFTGLSLMAKPFALVLPPLILGLELYRSGSTPALRRWLAAHKLYFAALALMSVSAASLAVLSQADVGQSETLDGLDRVLRLPGQILFYIAKSVWPWDLKLIYGSQDLLSNGLGLFLAGLLVLTAVPLSFRSKRFLFDMIFGLGFFIVTLAPLLKVVPFGDESPVSDRYLYISQTGLLWPWAMLAARGSGLLLIGVRTAALICLSFWVYLTWARLPAWENSIEMWQSHLRLDPDAKDAHENLARHYIGLERPEKALEHLKRGHSGKSDNLQNQAFALIRLGRIREAAEPLVQAERLTPTDPKFLNLKGNWLMESGDFKGAEDYYLKSLAVRSKLLTELVRAEALTNLGVLAFRKGDYTTCIQFQDRSLAVLPAYAYAYHNRALCLLSLKRNPEARADYEMTIRLIPGFAMAHNGLGVLALRQGDLEAAERHFANAVAADPSLEMARNNLALVRARRLAR